MRSAGALFYARSRALLRAHVALDSPTSISSHAMFIMMFVALA